MYRSIIGKRPSRSILWLALSAILAVGCAAPGDRHDTVATDESNLEADPTDYFSDRSIIYGQYASNPARYWATRGLPPLVRLGKMREEIGAGIRTDTWSMVQHAFDEAAFASAIDSGQVPQTFLDAMGLLPGEPFAGYDQFMGGVDTLIAERDGLDPGVPADAQRIAEIDSTLETVVPLGFDLDMLGSTVGPAEDKEYDVPPEPNPPNVIGPAEPNDTMMADAGVPASFYAPYGGGISPLIVTADAAPMDAPPPDAPGQDGGTADASYPDAGMDGGTADASYPDAGMDGGMDGGTADASTPDAGLDAGIEDASTGDASDADPDPTSNPADEDTTTSSKWIYFMSNRWDTTYHAGCVAQAVGPCAAKLGILEESATCAEFNDLSEQWGAPANGSHSGNMSDVATWMKSHGYCGMRASSGRKGFLGIFGEYETACDEARSALSRGCDVILRYVAADGSESHVEMVTGITPKASGSGCTVDTLSWTMPATVDVDTNGDNTYENKSDGGRYVKDGETKSYLQQPGKAYFHYFCKC